MSNKFTAKATSVLNKSLYLASELGHTYIGSEHLLLALTSESDSVAAKLLYSRGVGFENVKKAITERIGIGERTHITPNDLTPRTKHVIEMSAYHAARLGGGYIGTEHLLLSLADEVDSVAVRILSSLGVPASEVASDITAFLGEISGSSLPERPDKGLKLSDFPTLSQYGRDLTALARMDRLDPIIGRERETERVISILSRRTKNNPCLIGEPGVGKTAVVEGLARRIVEGNVPETLSGKIIVTLDLASMIAGAKYRGEFEERMKAMMTEATKNPSIILFIDEIHTLIGAGAAEGAVDGANILKPALARGEIRLIGATTISEYRKYIEKDAALERRFGAVNVGEPTSEEAVQILYGLRDRYESHHKVRITDEAIEAAVKLSVRYIGDRYLPDKAIDLIDEAASRVRIESFTSPPDLAASEEAIRTVRADKEEAIKSQDFEKAATLRDKERQLCEEYEKQRSTWQSRRDGTSLSIGKEDIANVITAQTGIPVKQLTDEEGEKIMHLSDILRSRIIGQDKAVEAIARAIQRGRVGLGDPNRPIGSFIFLGPTGVGKTELCRVLAEVLFGDKNAMVRVDMSEFMDRHSTSKMIGSPPGYVGYGEGGQLTEKIRRKPYCVVLFDEIEKAHPDVWSLLLQILEDGMLTDSQGRRVDFKNTVIIMTSNVGAANLIQPKKSLGFTESAGNDTESAVLASLRETFKPEFLNRVDEIIIFNKLGSEDIEKITRIMLDEVKKRIGALGIDVTFSPEVASMLAKVGYDEAYGARPLRRVISKKIEDTFAAAMLEGRIAPGMHISALLSDDEDVVYEEISE